MVKLFLMNHETLLFEKYKIISGSNEDLDVELEELLIYKEVRKLAT